MSYTEFNAAGALTQFAPQDPHWTELSPLVADKLSQEQLLVIDKWRELFHNVAHLLVPSLRAIYADNQSEEQRAVAYSLLWGYANSATPDDFVELIADANPKQFNELLVTLKSHKQQAVPLLKAKLDPPARFDEKLARRQCRIGIALFSLGEVELVARLLEQTEAPSLRTELIHEFAQFGVPASLVIARLKVEQHASAKQALILTLGEYPQDVADNDLIDTLNEWYRSDNDPGIHGSVNWLLRQWRQGDKLNNIDKELSSRDPPKGRGWYANRQGDTFTVVRNPDPFLMGSPEDDSASFEEERPQHWLRIGRSFAIATKEGSCTQYSQFIEESKSDSKVRNPLVDPLIKRYVPEPDCPIVDVTWREAAGYCNWLSRKEGLECCYPEEIELDKNKTLMTLIDADYLNRTGYRLPREVEWEFACRAGSLTSRPHGSGVARLGFYSQYLRSDDIEKATHQSVGQKKPNDWGLFDILGNACEWVDDPYKDYPAKSTRAAPVRDLESVFIVSENPGYERCRRGGNLPLARDMRSAFRAKNRPGGKSQAVGFRVARTISSD